MNNNGSYLLFQTSTTHSHEYDIFLISKDNNKREIIDKKYGGAQYLTIYRQINYGIISLILRKLHECYFKLKRNL